jgi:tetratricopeptide (TPR) repeat protein
VPPTIQALLAARLDQLEPAERSVLERGSIEGRTFHRGAVAALVDGDGQVDQRLVALVRKELVRPDRPQLPGDDAYRFRHLLIRDAAYEALPKATRADLHSRFAAWLEKHGQSLVELDEILGYHLEQAARYLGEVGQESLELALAAGDRLGAAGRRAFWRGDWRASVSLFERSLALTRRHRLEVDLEAALAQALGHTELARASAVADAAAKRAEETGAETGAALARTVAAHMRMQQGQSSPNEVERLAQEALPLLEAAGDDDGLVFVWHALGSVANMRFSYEAWAHAQEQALRHARRAGRPVVGSFMAAVGLVMGPRPASDALVTLDALVSGQPHPGDLVMQGVLLAMLDRIEEAWAVALPADERLRELGFFTATVWPGEIALIAGDYEAAARYLRDACEAMERAGSSAGLSTYAPILGRTLCLLGQPEEAESLAQKGRELGDPEDLLTQQAWRQTQALIHSGRGQHADAERLAREALDFSLRGDSLAAHGDAFCDLAEVLEAAGRREEAIAAWQEALDRYQRKQVIPLARRVRERLAQLQPA